MPHRSPTRRTFLRGVGAAVATATVGTGVAVASHSEEPSLSFPDGRALVLPQDRGPLQAAVRVEDVYMPEGGWVVIGLDPGFETAVGRSFRRLPAGHFEQLFVATQALEPGTYILYATLVAGGPGATFEDADLAGYDVEPVSATIAFE